MSDLMPDEQFYKLIDNLWNELVIIDPEDFTYIYLNKNALSNCGYSLEELRGMHISIITPDFPDIETARKFIEPLLNGKKKVMTYQTNRKRKDGSEYPIMVNLQYITFEEKPVLVAINRDLTREKMMEDIEITLGRFIENSWDEVLIHDYETCRILYANNGALKNTGYTLEEVTGFYHYDINPSCGINEQRECKKIRDELLLEGKEKFISKESSYKRKDGTLYPVEIRGSLIEFQGQKAVITVAKDLTYIKEKEELKESLGEILENSWNEVFIFNRENLNFIYANKEALKNIGYTLKELKNLSPLDLKPGFNKENFFELIHPLLSGDKDKVVFETIHERKDGSIYDCEIKLSSGIFEETPVFIAIIQDITERKKYYEDKLNRAEKEKSIILDNIKEIVIFMSPDFRVLWANKMAEEKTGTPLKQMIGRSCYEIWQKKRWNCEECLVVKARNTGVIQKSELIGKDGKFWLISAVPIKNENNEVTGVVETTLDITERKIYEEEILQARERFELAVKGSQDGIWDWDLNSNELYLSSRWKEMIGYEDHELENKFSTFENLLHPEDKEKVLNAAKMYINGELSTYNQEFRFRHKNGSYIWVHARGEAMFSAQGIPYRMAGSHKDITNRKKQEEKLKKKDKLLSAVAEASIELLSVHQDLYSAISKAFKTIGQAFDVDRIYLFKNSVINKKLYANHKFEWRGNKTEANINDSFFKKISYEVIPEFKNTLMRNKPLIRHVRDMASASKNFFISKNIKSIFAIPLFVNDSFWGFIGFDECKEERVWTISERAAFNSFAAVLVGVLEKDIREKELINEKQKAESANRAKNDFLANTSHEIRTPLNGVIGFIDLLSQTELTKEQVDYIKEIKNSSKVLLTVINDILDLSKIEAGMVSIDNTSFDIYSLIEYIKAVTKSFVLNKNIEVASKICPNVPQIIIGDEGKLKQVFNNLCNNAAKFTENGQINIYVEIEKETEKDIILRFNVEDTGIGIPENKQKEIFESFMQADSSSTRKYGGTGLGLSISKNFIKIMGGEIQVESKEGKGSVFSFTANFEKEKNYKNITSDEISLNDSDKEKNTKYKILIVEDNEINLKLTLKLLDKAGYCCDVAKNGAEALEAYNNCGYDLILMDCQMPVMDGYKAAREIRNIESFEKSNKYTPIIAITAHASRGEPEKCFLAGMDDYISKPLKYGDLIKKIENFLNAGINKFAKENPEDKKDNFLTDRTKFVENISSYTGLSFTESEELLKEYLEQFPEILTELSAEIEKSNFKKIESVAHNIKGASSNLRLDKLRETAIKLEKSATAGDIKACREILRQIFNLQKTLGH